jgi:predicted membrane protein
MSQLTLKTAIRAYLTIILIVGIIVSPFPQFALAIALLSLLLYTTYKTPKTNINIAITTGTIIFTPLTIVSIAGGSLAVLFIIPAIYSLDQTLRENAQTQAIKPQKEGRKPTVTLRTLLAALCMIFLAALMTFNVTLLLTTISIIAYVAVILGYSIHAIPKKPFQETKTWNRTLVGNTANNTTEITTNSKVHLHTTLAASEPWIEIKPAKFTTTNHAQTVNITCTPPLLDQQNCKSTLQPLIHED